MKKIDKKFSKYKHILNTEKVKQNLKDKTIRGGLNTMAGKGIVFALRIGSMAILARMLVPEYFGLISMITALTAFAERFKDLGLSIATIQRESITHAQVSTLFWINSFVGKR
jgi:O-antigen/teichoic acid export membrane protein